MSENKRVVEKYIDGFNKSDHKQILSCLTDDVEWEMPGFFHLHGKDAFDKEIENPAFSGKPVVKILRLFEENNAVIVEGSVKSKKSTGEDFHAMFCDIFDMKKGKIRKLTGYLHEIKKST
jgi:uncharacterized protein